LSSREHDPVGNGVPLELRELRYFVVLCDELHFGRAAERLHISQSPLSQAIAQLERKLGTRLLDRSSRHVQITDAGSVLVHHARRLLREADHAVGATKRAGAGENGTIRLAVGPVSRDGVLSGLRHALDERVPGLTVDVVEVGGDEVVETVLSGGADAGLVLNPRPRDDLSAVPLRRDSAVAMMLRGHPLSGRESVTLEELARHTLLLWPRGTSRAAHDLVLTLFVENMPAAMRIAEPRSGAAWDALHADAFAVVPASSAVSGDFVAVPIDDADIEFTIVLVWSTGTPPAVLPAVLDAADAAADENGWLKTASATSDGRGAMAGRLLRPSSG
jgi:DNA-binding transcriptional LysR family regulator